jgi:uncharacterized protein YcgI (DUF1989 family)
MSGETHTVPARRGKAIRLGKGETITIINPAGTQVADTWCLNADDPEEFMSMEHIRPTLTRIFPEVGDDLVSNRRRPILHFLEDTSPGRHDTLIAACDSHRYALLGCTSYHDNCTDNFHAALRLIGVRVPVCPSPLNLWMNIPVDPQGNTEWGEPLSKPGDRVTFRACLDCIVVLSACPQDILPVNGRECVPTSLEYVLNAR